MSSILSGSYTLSTFSSARFPGVIWRCSTGLGVPRSLTLHVVQSWVSVFVPMYWRMEVSVMMTEKTSIYGYSRMSLGVTLCLGSLSRTVAFGLSLMILNQWCVSDWPRNCHHVSHHLVLRDESQQGPEFHSQVSVIFRLEFPPCARRSIA